MYTTALLVHSWLRWVVLILGLIAAGRALTAGRRQWTRSDHQAGLLFGIAFDIQTLIGLILYFLLSPFTGEALQNIGAAMQNSGLRFWAVEHPFGMFVALALVHIGNARIRKTYDDRRKPSPRGDLLQARGPHHAPDDSMAGHAQRPAAPRW